MIKILINNNKFFKNFKNYFSIQKLKIKNLNKFKKILIKIGLKKKNFKK